MRRLVMAVVAALVVLGSLGAAAQDLEGTVGMSGAWALYPMAVRWGEEFQKLHPKVRFDTSAGGAGKGMTDVLTGAVDIGLVSRDISAVEVEKGALGTAVTKDAVVPMISVRNPVLKDLQAKGAKKEILEGLWVREDVKTWGQIAGTGEKAAMRVYTRSDACGAAETWAKFLGGKKQEDLKGIGVYGDPGLGEAVRRDPLAVGYNNVNFAYDAKTRKPVEGLAVMPLDVNGNGRLDKAEDFYATRESLVEAIKRGDYPSPPARDLYFVTRGRPTSPVLTAFIRWVLTDGQKFVEEAGYISLAQDKLDAGLKALDK